SLRAQRSNPSHGIKEEWIASRSLSSGAHSRDPLARNDVDSVSNSNFDRSPQTEKLVPQPHDAVAFGLTTRNEAPIRSSTKSTSEPARNGTEAGSTSTTAPSRAITRSSSALAWSTSNLYWKPEQPPPSTEMRSMAPSPSTLRISPMRRAARSLTVMAASVIGSSSPELSILEHDLVGKP